MLSLPQVLHEAQRHAVVEIAIEPGEPVTFHGEQGVLVLGEALGEGEISEALSQVLAPEQQADLAVASVVEFHVPGFAEWTFVAETSTDGVVIRGRIREGDTPQEYGAPLDLPPLEPFEYERSSEIPRSSSVLRQAGPGETRWDVGAVTGDEAAVVTSEVERVPTGSLEDPTLASTMAQVHRVEPEVEADELSLPPLGQSADAEDNGVIDFALVGRTAPTTDVPSVLDDNETTAPRITPEPEEPSEPRGDGTLSLHVVALNAGTVVHLQGMGAGTRLLKRYSGSHTVIEGENLDEVLGRPLEEIPLGEAYLVRLEDPGACLPWLLRRLEEGSCVIVETRARTLAGARRCLLGAAPSLHVARWLDAHKHVWIYADGRAWVLEE